MPLYIQHQCNEPEVLEQVKRQELKMENLINKYRVMIIIFLFVTDLIAMHFLGGIRLKEVYFSAPIIIFLTFGLYKLHNFTKCGKHKPYIKYFTILIDYSVISFGLLHSNQIICNTTGIDLKQLVLIATILLILVNSTSALRIQYNVIKFSTIIGIVFNVLVHFYLGSGWGIILYTSVFIILSGLFNLYIAGFIFSSFIANYNLENANKSLEDANHEINSQNEEIKTQNDELETQNDYLATQRDQISYQKKQLTSSIEYAKHIQQAMLPNQIEFDQIVPQNFIFFRPKDIVSGDFYWARKVEIDNINYSIYATVDCTGHGVPGGFMSMMGFSFLNEITSQLQPGFSASEILNEMREKVKAILHQSNKELMVRDGMDMTICVIDYENLKLQYAGANNPLYIIGNDNLGTIDSIREYIPDKMPVGVHLKEKKSFSNYSIDIKKGDMLYTFSDGFIDQFGGEKGEKFKKKRFKYLLESISNLSVTEQKNKVSERFEAWKLQTEQLDDVCVIGVKI